MGFRNIFKIPIDYAFLSIIIEEKLISQRTCGRKTRVIVKPRGLKTGFYCITIKDVSV